MTNTENQQTAALPLHALAPFTAPPLTVHDSVRYQGASGDLNPIHHDAQFATSAGFPQPFAVGMRQAGLLANRVISWLGPESVRSINFRFQAQAWPGEALTYTCEVTDLAERGGVLMIGLTMACLRPDGTAHLTGSATCAVPTDSETAGALLADAPVTFPSGTTSTT